MYEIMIRANTDQIHAFVFQYMPIRTQKHSPIRAQYNQIRTYTSSNTDQYTHHRPMHTSSFSILAFKFLFANTGIDTVKSGAPAHTAAPSSTSVSEVSDPPKPYTAAHLWAVGVQFVGVVRQPNFSRRRKFLERRFGEKSLHCRLLGRQNRCQCP